MKLSEMKLSEKVLTELHACADAIKFCKNNELFGYPLNRLDEVVGDYRGYVNWLKGYMMCEFNEREQLTLLALPNGFKTGYEYNERGLLVKIIHQAKNNETMEYDDKDRLIRTNRSDGKTVWYTYNDEGKKDMMIIDDYVEYYAYDDRGNMVAKTNSNGDVHQYQYDENGRMTKDIRDMKNIYGAGNCCVYTYKYDAAGNMIYMQYMNGTPIIMEYDERGNKIKEFMENESDRFWSWKYDERGNVIEERYSSLIEQKRYDSTQYEFEYYPDGKLKRACDMYVPQY